VARRILTRLRTLVDEDLSHPPRLRDECGERDGEGAHAEEARLSPPHFFFDAGSLFALLLDRNDRVVGDVGDGLALFLTRDFLVLVAEPLLGWRHEG
jgi:hypothetical protein